MKFLKKTSSFNWFAVIFWGILFFIFVLGWWIYNFHPNVLDIIVRIVNIDPAIPEL